LSIETTATYDIIIDDTSNSITKHHRCLRDSMNALDVQFKGRKSGIRAVPHYTRPLLGFCGNLAAEMQLLYHADKHAGLHVIWPLKFSNFNEN
jgi:hypothetical protein